MMRTLPSLAIIRRTIEAFAPAAPPDPVEVAADRIHDG
jgi:hypothetical protein